MRIPIVLIASILTAAFCWAQPSGVVPPQLKAYLSLTDAQVQSLQAIQTSLQSSIAPLRQQIDAKRSELNTAIRSGSASAATLGQLQLDIQALEKQIADLQAAAQPQKLAVLTSAQQALLQKLVDAQKLQPAVREAEMVGLIPPPPGGPGRGMGMGMGRGMGPGPGPAGMGGPMMGPRRGGRGAPPPQQ